MHTELTLGGKAPYVEDFVIATSLYLYVEGTIIYDTIVWDYSGLMLRVS